MALRLLAPIFIAVIFASCGVKTQVDKLTKTSSVLATDLSWQEGSASSNTTVNANWQLPAGSEISYQQIDYFLDPSCSIPEGTTAKLPSSATGHTFTGAQGLSYYFTIQTLDKTGRRLRSECSSGIFIDSLPPSPATGLVWMQPTPFSSTEVRARWTPSTAQDLAAQRLIIYSDSTCSIQSSDSGLLSEKSNTFDISAMDGATLSYKILSFDGAGNITPSGCSLAMTIDLTAPASATSLGWEQASPSNTLSLTASWTPSPEGDLIAQKIVFYTDPSCSTQADSSATLGANANRRAFTATDGSSYTYQIESTYSGGNTSVSACSAQISVDTNAPDPASSLAWAQASPHNSTVLEAVWTPSPESALSGQEIVFYEDASCLTEEGTSAILDAGTNSHTFTGSANASYTFKIKSTYTSGDPTESACSSLMTINLNAPDAAQALSWQEGTPSNNINVTASWIPSTDPDLQSQTISFYSEANCSGSASGVTTLGNTTNTFSYAGSDGNIYSYKIKSSFAGGDEKDSLCSEAMTIDLSAPNPASVLLWAEGSPHNGVTVTATWTPSDALDLVSQNIIFYTGSSCQNLEGTTASVGSATSSYSFGGNDLSSYSYKVESVHTSGNMTISACSSDMSIDLSVAGAANNLAWGQTSPHNSSSISASWTPTSSPGLVSQTVSFYNGAGCVAPETAQASIGASVGSYSFSGVDGGSYSFNVSSHYSNGDIIDSSCSSTMSVDTTAPLAATGINWGQGTPYPYTSITASWTPSVSADLASQTAIFYTGAGCVTAEGTTATVSASATGQTLTGTDGNTYSYRIRSEDLAGNTSLSACSSSLAIDSNAPESAKLLAWQEASPHNLSTVNASWAPSTAGDLTAQTIILYSDASCSVAEGTTAALSASDNTYAFSGADGNAYAFIVQSSHSSGYTINSACSPLIAVDTSAPAPAISPAWLEPTPYASTSITAAWSPSISADLASQTVIFYTDASCSTPEGSSSVLGASSSTLAFTGTDQSSYTFIVRSMDSAGNTSDSACSSLMNIDSAAPASATALAWSEASPHNTVNVSASWSPAAAGDLVSQTIVFYTDSACSAAQGTSAILGPSDNSYAFTGIDGGSYYYDILSSYSNGDTVNSACSSGISIDTSSPAPAALLSWSEGSPHNSLSVTAVWTPSAAGDLSAQTISFYTGSGCSVSAGVNATLGPAANSYSFGGSDLTSYSYRISSADAAGNLAHSACSPAISIDTSAPDAASSIGWTHGSPHNSLSLSALWAPSAEPDLASQEIIFYSGAGCSVAQGTTATLGAGDYSYIFTGSDGASYSYRIESTHSDGDITLSACSSEMTIDTSAPAGATALSWYEASPHNSVNLNALWTPSSDPTLSNQTVVFYTDATCSNVQGTSATLAAGVNSFAFIGSDGGQYAFKVNSTFSDGSAINSGCSSPIAVDASAPDPATGISWVEGSPSNTTAVNAAWTPSTDSNLVSQEIVFYHGGGCIIPEGTSSTLGAAVSSQVFTGSNGSSYSFRVISAYSGGNTTQSACSSEMSIDTTAPAPASSPSWAETSPHSGLAVTANWTPSPDAGLSSQEVILYSGAGCLLYETTSSVLAASANSYVHTGIDGESYSFIIRSAHASGHTTESSCSTVMSVDTTSPDPALALGWAHASPYNSTSLTALWSLSASADVASQAISIFSDTTCSTPLGSPTALAAGSTSSSFTGDDGSSYSYRITTVDSAGNSTLSSCSSEMAIDTTVPDAASGLSWANGSPHTSTTLLATWTPSSSQDLTQQTFMLYSGSSCSSFSGSSVLSVAANSNSFTGVDGQTYSYIIRSTYSDASQIDSACSSAVSIDTSAASQASGLSWAQTSPHSGLAIDADWTPSSDPGLASQTINIYYDAGCLVSEGSSSPLSAAASTYAFTATDGNSYAFKITSHYSSGTTSDSVCSSLISVDTTAPAAPSVLAWAHGSPHNSATITANWTPSSSTDVAGQTITYYNGSGCSVAEGTVVSLSASASSHNFSGANGQSYSYIITSVDTAGNSSVSSCSTEMAIDTAAANPATLLLWNEGSPHNTTSITAAWTPSDGANLTGQTIIFYTGASCGALEGTTAGLGPADTSYSFTGTDGLTYSYKIQSAYSSGPTTESVCSQAISIDTSSPNPATGLGWIQGSPYNSTDVTARWTVSSSSGLSGQTITFYSGAGCSTMEGSPVDIAAGAGTYAFTGIMGASYTYKVTSKFTGGEVVDSPCSSLMELDSSAQPTATALGWNETSPHGYTSLNATWTPSISPSLTSQSITFYTDGSCLNPEGTTASGLADTTNTYALTGINGNSYAFKITSSYADGSTNESSCSSLMSVDTSLVPVASSFTPTDIYQNNEESIALSFTSSETVVSCSVSGLNNVTVISSCACSSGVCSVGLKGANGYTGAAGFDFNVSTSRFTSASASANFNILAPTPFEMIWKTDNPGSASNQITLPLVTGGDYNFTVDWGDGNSDTISSASDPAATHSYAAAGTYTVQITGVFDRMAFVTGGDFDSGWTYGSPDKEKLIDITSWGSNQWATMRHAFQGCSNLQVSAVNAPNLEYVTDMSYMFADVMSDIDPSPPAMTFNSPIGHWDVSGVLLMEELFAGAQSFNQDISGWDVSNVTNMGFMFAGASAFNQDISVWNVANVTDFDGMFGSAASFNQDISVWDTSGATDMNFMFEYATAFNQPIGAWNTAGVTDMLGMFKGASSFNQNLSSWNTSSVTRMAEMFQDAAAFDGAIGAWNTSAVTDMREMFSGAGAFNQDISAWDTSVATDMNLMFENAAAFNQDLGGWDVTNVTNSTDFDLGASSWVLAKPAF